MIESCPKVIEKKGVFVARSLVNLDSHKILVRVLNHSDGPKRLYREMILGLGSQFKKTEVVSIKARSVGTNITNEGLLPDHVQTLWNECKFDLSLTEQMQVKNLLIEYSDVFAKSQRQTWGKLLCSSIESTQELLHQCLEGHPFQNVRLNGKKLQKCWNMI